VHAGPKQYFVVVVVIVVMDSTLLYATLRYSTLVYATLRYSTLLYSTLLYATLRYSTLLYATLRYSTLLFFLKSILSANKSHFKRNIPYLGIEGRAGALVYLRSNLKGRKGLSRHKGVKFFPMVVHKLWW
jgi:hypothetical protein